MKIAKIALPIAILSLIGFLVAMFVFNSTSHIDDEDQIATALGILFIFVFTVIPMIAFIPFGVGIIICELFILFSRRKFAALTGALVLMCILFPIVLFVAIISLGGLGQYSTMVAVIVSLCLALYIAALVAVFIAYFKTRKMRKEQEK